MDHEGIDNLAARLERLEASLSRLGEQVSHTITLSNEIRQLVGPFGVPMPDGSMLVQTIHNLKYLIDPTDKIMAPQLIVYRQWEAELTRLFLHNLHADSVFVDVGANFGYFTCLAGNRIGPLGSGKVFSYEPNPRLFPLLESNCEINWSLAPVQLSTAAVGATAGIATISVPLNGAANATLSSVSDDCERHEVPIISLDDDLADNLQVSWMKIDVEGHEHAVLQGAKGLISRSPDIRIVIEWSLSQMHDAGVAPDDMFALFCELGLVASSVPPSGLVGDVQILDWERLRQVPYDNLLLWRP